MTAAAVKSKLRAVWAKIAIWLWVVAEFAAIVVFVVIAEQEPPDRLILAGGIVVLSSSFVVVMAGLLLCASMLAVSVGAIWRRRRLHRRFSVAEILGLLLVAVMGLFAWRAGDTSVLTLSPVGVTFSAPGWRGGVTRSQLLYADIDWLAQREHIIWKKDREIGGVIIFRRGVKTGWHPDRIWDCVAKMKSGVEERINGGWQVNGVCDEILSAARAADVTIKTGLKVIDPKPAD